MLLTRVPGSLRRFYSSGGRAAPFDALAYNGMQVNGNVDISTELGTTGATLVNNTNKYTADCWEAMYNHTAATAVVTSGQVAAASFPVALPGYSFGHQIKATTALTAPANGDFGRHRHQIEGYRVARLGWGTASAQPIAFAFQFYSTVSGVAFVRATNSAGNRAYHREITVAAGWNWIAQTIPGDTSGTWQATTSAGLIIDIFSAGKAAAPATPDAWSATPAIQTTNSTNLLGTNNNLTIVTGFIVLPGIELPSLARAALIMRPFDAELLLCGRYLRKLGFSTIGRWYGGRTESTTVAVITFPLTPAMRAIPTVTKVGAGTITINDGSVNETFSSMSTVFSAPDSLAQQINTGATLTANRGIFFSVSANDTGFLIDARL